MLSSLRALAPRRLPYLLTHSSLPSTYATPFSTRLSANARQSPTSKPAFRQLHSSLIVRNSNEAARKVEEDELEVVQQALKNSDNEITDAEAQAAAEARHYGDSAESSTLKKEDIFDESIEEAEDAAQDSQPMIAKSISKTIKSAVMSKLTSKPPMAATRNVDGVDMSFQRLADLKLVDERLINTIVNRLKYVDMTEVQAKTIMPALAGGDVLAQARTGTGKTLAFMLPSIHRILNSARTPPAARKIDIRCIVISPTRELALQIAEETRVLCQGTHLTVQSAVGGTGKGDAVRQMRSQGCHILVATPGRLNDLLSDQRIGLNYSKLESLIFDEADTLLDQGFADEIRQITQQLPRQSDVDRQTLMFSATVTTAVQAVAKAVMKKNQEFVNTIDPNEQPTHMRVPQYVVQVASVENIMPTILEIVKTEMAHHGELPFKAIVFFNTTRAASLAAAIFQRLRPAEGAGGHPLAPLVLTEIHGRLMQTRRSHIAEQFRKAESGILFASDVVARGMHFPNVTHVIQVGLPMTREQYIHRIGRTARGASTATGKGFLILSRMEYQETMNLLRGLQLIPNQTLGLYDTSQPKLQGKLLCPDIDMSKTVEVSRSTAEILTQIIEAAKMVPYEDKEAMYLAYLGYYTTRKLVSHRFLFKELARLCRFQWGMQDVIPISPGLLNKMRIPLSSAAEFEINIGSRSGSGSAGLSGLEYSPRAKQYDRGVQMREWRGKSDGAVMSPGNIGRIAREQRSSSYSSDRPSYGDRPQRSSSYSGDRPSYGDRPQRSSSYGGERPSYGDKPQRSSYGDRPQRSSYGDRPQRSSYGDSGERPKRSYGEGSSPSYSDRGSSGGPRSPKKPWEGRGRQSSRY